MEKSVSQTETNKQSEGWDKDTNDPEEIPILVSGGAPIGYSEYSTIFPGQWASIDVGGHGPNYSGTVTIDPNTWQANYQPYSMGAVNYSVNQVTFDSKRVGWKDIWKIIKSKIKNESFSIRI